jgi:hypothetical protein
VQFSDCLIEAKLTLDATELGDLLALAEVPYRWGWEWQSQWQEPSAPVHPSTMTQLYPVQAPTWVFVLQDFEPNSSQTSSQTSGKAPANLVGHSFSGTWEGYGVEQFLNYGRLPGNRFMINWPQQGNDYGLQANRLIQSEATRQEFLQEAFDHAQAYADFLQQQLGHRYGLAKTVFPESPYGLGGGAFALHPYYRESRRLQGVTTVREQDILPIAGGRVAALPLNSLNQTSAIAIGNYANDHHYPGFKFALHPKSLRWGGRWTGTPFALPYECLIPAAIDGLLVCEKNISVSHIANGATRLQPAVLGIGQAAGMAAALCIERHCQPRDLSVRELQDALLKDPIAPMAVVPLFNLSPEHPEWLHWQRYYLDYPDAYPADGNAPLTQTRIHQHSDSPVLTGVFQRVAEQSYSIALTSLSTAAFSLVTLDAEVDQQLQQCQTGQTLRVAGRLNRAGNWLLAEEIHSVT